MKKHRKTYDRVCFHVVFSGGGLLDIFLANPFPVNNQIISLLLQLITVIKNSKTLLSLTLFIPEYPLFRFMKKET